MYSNYGQNSNKSPKKKKRKHSVENTATTSPGSNRTNNVQTNTTINIIDRVLDLGKYDKETSLYTLSRDWMNATTLVSDSKPVKKEGFINEETRKIDNPYYIYKLPEPIYDQEMLTIDQLNDDIKQNIRESERNDLELIKRLDVDEYMQTHALLKLHVNRWKQARGKWSYYYEETNKPYKNSYDCLKSLFEEFQ